MGSVTPVKATWPATRPAIFMPPRGYLIVLPASTVNSRPVT